MEIILMKRRSKEEWRSLVTEQASSGKSLESFCAERGISASSFSNWQYKLKREQFVELPVVTPSEDIGTSRVVVELPSGAVLSFSW